ncbi:MAG: cupin, partial [Candidatus Bathyarchaeum sp.]
MKPNVRKPTKQESEDAESWPIWEKEESEFPWEYDDQETCRILEGKAVVKTPEETIEFGVG